MFTSCEVWCLRWAGAAEFDPSIFTRIPKRYSSSSGLLAKTRSLEASSEARMVSTLLS